MKKLIAISLLFIFLGANTEVTQLLKLSVLMHHFLEHQHQEPNETFANFLSEHYANKHNHADSEHHNQDHHNLPFKTIDCATDCVLVIFRPLDFQSPFPITTTFHDKILPNDNGVFYASAVFSNIWQPPKNI